MLGCRGRCRARVIQRQVLASGTAASLMGPHDRIVDSFPTVRRHMLIVGGSGVVGRAGVQLFDSLGSEWRVTAVTMDPKLDFPITATTTRNVSVNLTDARACQTVFGAMKDVTHVVYAAMFENVDDVFASFGSPQEVETNDRMFRNCLSPLIYASRGLRSVQILQGGKAYGVHKIGIKASLTPYKERSPRVEHGESFYWRQEDFLKECQRESGGSWHYTIWRPSLMFGFSSKSPFNFLFALAAHAVTLRELGQPLAYTGAPAKVVSEFTDCRLQAKAFLWASMAPTAANQAFNITNGDHMIWQNVYPKLAAFFGMESAPPEPAQLSVEMQRPEMRSAWAHVVQKHGLALGEELDEVNAASFRMADFNIGMTRPLPPNWKDSLHQFHGLRAGMINSTVRLRQAGFHEYMDTEDTFLDWIREMQAMRAIPK